VLEVDDQGSTSAWTRWLASGPELSACAVAGFSLPSMLLLLAGHLSWPIAFPIGLLGAIGAVLIAGRTREDVASDVVRWTAIVLGFLLIWTLVNCLFSAEDLYAHRDPTTYNLAGRYLVDHQSLRIDTQPEIFGTPAGYSDSSAGFQDFHPGLLAVQGNHLLPVLLGAAGRIFGNAGVLKANVVFAALGLFAFFGLARRVVGPRFGALATAALAISLPVLYVSRDTFSEPLALLLLMGALTLLQRAIQSGRVAEYAMCGFVGGASAMVRIDSYASLLALVVAGAVILAHARAGDRRSAVVRIGALVVVGLVPTVIGWVDVSRLSPAYYADQRHAILRLAGAAVGLGALGVVSVLMIWRGRLGPWLGSHRAPLAKLAMGSIIAAFLFLAGRPLWYVGHGVYTPYLLQVQKNSHEALDGTRTYDELTVSWQALYFGWPTVVLGVVGYAILARRFLLRRDWPLIGALTMGLGLSALYLYTSQITPDQIWASRRYVPVVMPMMLVAAAWTLCVLGRRRRWLARAGGAVVLIYPLVVTIAAFTIREGHPQLRQVDAICGQLPPDAAVVTVEYNASWSYQMTVRAYCDVPIISLDKATPAQLATMQAAAQEHGRELFAMSTESADLDFDGPASALSTVRAERWPSSLHTSPRGASHETISVFLGRVQADGTVVALTR